MTKHLSKPPLRRANVLRSRGSDAGFTLIEILVAMVVLAIGLLGVAAMQLRGLQYSHDAYLRSQISVLAFGMADRMRLNQANAVSYVSAFIVNPAAPPPACVVGAVSAANDLACWQGEVFNALPPSAQANIAAVVGRPGEFTISLQWDSRGGTTRTANYTVQP
jgi:type IV pilus assembly protein PilV